MIPKKIHFVWVGTESKSELVERCIASWRKYLPEYSLCEWDNDRCAAVATRYSREAFENRKWAFVSDYIRLYALLHEGGIYLDADAEITAPLDPFLVHDFFSGYELYNGRCLPVTAVMGASAGNSIIADLIEFYATAPFESAHNFDLEPNTIRIARYFEQRFGLQPPYESTATTYLDAASVIYPASHFCAPAAGFPSFAIHHFNNSWFDAFARRTKLELPGGYLLVRLKRNLRVPSAAWPLYKNERLIFAAPIAKGKFLALIKRRSATPV